MSRNPVVNALIASGYVTMVSVMMFYGTKMIGPTDSVLAPMAMLSLLSFSAAVMGYAFIYQPAMMYFSGKKKAGVKLFLQTLGVFGVITAIFFGLLFSRVIE